MSQFDVREHVWLSYERAYVSEWDYISSDSHSNPESDTKVSKSIKQQKQKKKKPWKMKKILWCAMARP